MCAAVVFKLQNSCLKPPQQACTCILTVQLSQPLGDNCTAIQGRMPTFKTILISIHHRFHRPEQSFMWGWWWYLWSQSQGEEGWEIPPFFSLSGHLCLFLIWFSRVFQGTTLGQTTYKLCWLVSLFAIMQFHQNSNVAKSLINSLTLTEQ